MNIIEAEKSGKPFKRAQDDIWIRELKQFFIETEKYYTGHHIICVVHDDATVDDLLLDDLLADDWVVLDEL